MKLGIAKTLPHSSPEEWAKKHRELGLEAVVFPCAYTENTKIIDAYAAACKTFDLQIAEVGAWKNLMASDKKERMQNFEYCIGQLELAEYVGADCCVNIAGAKGEIWDGAYSENYSEHTYAEIVSCVQKIIDRVKPKKTFYTLEPMPWMHPDSPEDYLQMIRDIKRPGFAVHMDIVNMIDNPKKYLFNKDFTDKAFSILGKYIKSCHIKDIILKNTLPCLLTETQPGTGGFDLKNYIAKAEEVNPDITMIIEHLGDDKEYINAVKYINSVSKER